MVWGPWELGLWGLLGGQDLGAQGSLGHVPWDLGLPNLRKGLHILGSPKGGSYYLKNREFSGNLASTWAVGHVGWASYKALGVS